MSIESIWEPDFEEEANFVYGTKDKSHPAVNYLFHMSNKVYLGGKVKKISMPIHYDYRKYRLNPSEVKTKFIENGWDKIVDFQVLLEDL